MQRRRRSLFTKSYQLSWDEFLLKVGQTEKGCIHRRVILEQEGRCADCSNYEWMGKPIPTELEHINGDHHNDDRDNLKVLCPNCHALTSTWRGRNKERKIVSDEILLEALRKEPSIRKALISVGLAGKGGNYQRCYKLRGSQALR